MYVLTPQEMRDADADAVARVGDVALMRTAGDRIADFIATSYEPGRVVAFAGPGNNGGDAFAALAQLDPSYERVVYAAPAPRPSPARNDAESRARARGVVIHSLPATDDAARGALAGASLALDGLFGTGTRLPLGEAFRAAARALDARTLPVLAIDIPSGIDALTGACSDDCVRAGVTLTLAAAKPGLLLDPARERVGALWIAEIGIDDHTLGAHARSFAALDDDALLSLLPQRAPGADKRSAGAPLIIAGSQQFPGAAVLCARAAARAGAGYVTVATPQNAAQALRAHLVEQVVVTFPEEKAANVVDELLEIAQRNTAIALGPGLGLDKQTGAIVRGIISRTDLPMVIDASALFHLAKHLEILRGKRAVITPHAGEFARLSGEGTVSEGARVSRLRSFVERTGITTLLKGRATLIDDGTVMHINPTGTNALATAGTGDVLTGMIATLLSAGLSPLDAARAAAYWHGRAGRYCALQRRLGVIAGDLPEALGAALPTRSPKAPLRCVLPLASA